MADTYKQQLLKETLNQKFDMERFVRFVSEFFNDVQMTNQYVPDVRIWGEYREQIKSFIRVGKYIDGNKKKVDIFAIEVNRESTVERARSLQRNFVSRLITGTATAAIVAFYDPQSENWRLSFVKLDYAFTPKGVKVEVTPAKRYSYLVGKGEGIHTVQRQLLPIFENERDNPTVEQIEEAFSVETVTKEFFNSYKEEYLRLKEYLEGNEVFAETAEKNNFTSEQFAKKLMGQLAFLYFLQKKGWLGVGVAPKELTKAEFEEIYYNQKSDPREVLKQHYVVTPQGNYKRYKIEELEKDKNKADMFAGCFRGTKFYNPWGKGNTNFIRSIYTNCSKRSLKFFDDFLEPLFYNALNNPRGENDYFPRFNSKIPFLNGGLFEPLFANWEAVDFNIPNAIFSKEGTDSKVDGILDVFDTFNFTINEDEPLEREVAVDPEMLGKIFENLLDVKDRKSKGAFYTPREIVHYMCQESLINYLVNETSVPYEDMRQFVLYGEVMTNQDSSKKTLDGDQARLIPESVFERLDSIDEKLDSVRIADPAVGSGAFPLGILNEVVKLRNNITQYMLNRIPREFRMEREGLLKRRNPYTLKWNTIQNCIFAVDIEASAVDITKLRLWLSLIVDQQIDDVNEKPHALPNLDCNIMCGNSLIEEFEGIQLFDERLLEQVDLSKPLQQKQTNVTQLTLDTAKQEQELDTMFKELFAMQGGLFGEDDPARKKEIKDKIEKKTSDIIDYKLNGIDKNHEAAKRYRQSIDNHEKPYFIWKLEFARVFKEKDGFDIVIGNPPYVSVKAIPVEQKEIFAKAYIAGQGRFNLFTLMLELGYRILKDNGVLSYILPEGLYTNIEYRHIRELLIKNTSIGQLMLFSNRVFENAAVDTSVISFGKNQSIDNSFDIYRDLKEFVTTIEQKEIREEFNYMFPVNHTEKNKNLLKRMNEIPLKLDTVLEIQQGIIYSGQPKEKVFSNQMLDTTYKKVLDGRDINRWSIKWDIKEENKYIRYTKELHRPREERIFLAEEKLLMPRKSTKLTCTLDKDSYYALNTAYVGLLKTKKYDISIKYLIACLNSKLYNFYYRNTYLGWQITIPALKKLPIIEPGEKVLQQVNGLVDEIMIDVKENKSIQLKEREIDNIIYEIFQLTEEEIQLVESGEK